MTSAARLAARYAGVRSRDFAFQADVAGRHGWPEFTACEPLGRDKPLEE
jgi:hypothetical protein